MDFLHSSTKWDLGQMEDSSSIDATKSRESELNENGDTKLNEFTGDLEIWTDSDGADTDEFFLLFGRQQPEEARSFEDSHAAAGTTFINYLLTIY
jgi:hypothetical protein